MERFGEPWSRLGTSHRKPHETHGFLSVGLRKPCKTGGFLSMGLRSPVKVNVIFASVLGGFTRVF